MKIIIAGAGDVGQHLARKLAREEQQDITLIDPNARTLEKIGTTEDLLTYRGDPTDFNTLIGSGIREADLFVSVMPSEETNLIACSLARTLGGIDTMARISSPRFMQQEYSPYISQLGIGQLIYPEGLAAEEINIIFRNPWARQYIELLGGGLVVVGVKVRDGAEVVGRRLDEIGSANGKQFHIVAIKRGSETIIPSGTTHIEHGDIVYFSALADDIDAVRSIAGKQLIDVKRVVIMGLGHIAQRAIEQAPESIHFTVIESDKERINELRNWLPSNVSLFHGDGRDTDFLAEVGLHSAQVFAALTKNSETNILACLAAKEFGVFKTIAKEENIDYIPLAERLDIGTIINKKLIAVGNIYRALMGQDTSTVKCLTIANTDVAEVVVRSESRIVGKPVHQLHLPGTITLGGMLRNGVPRLIDGNTIIEPYDRVVVFCHNMPMRRVRAIFEA